MRTKITREAESKLPIFKSHDEARAYFKNEYGDDFMMVDSDIINNEKVYYYKLILDRDAFKEMIELQQKGKMAEMDEKHFFSWQDVSINENGSVHVVQ